MASKEYYTQCAIDASKKLVASAGAGLLNPSAQTALSAASKLALESERIDMTIPRKWLQDPNQGEVPTEGGYPNLTETATCKAQVCNASSRAIFGPKGAKRRATMHTFTNATYLPKPPLQASTPVQVPISQLDTVSRRPATASSSSQADFMHQASIRADGISSPANGFNKAVKEAKAGISVNGANKAVKEAKAGIPVNGANRAVKEAKAGILVNGTNKAVKEAKAGILVNGTNKAGKETKSRPGLEVITTNDQASAIRTSADASDFISGGEVLYIPTSVALPARMGNVYR